MRENFVSKLIKNRVYLLIAIGILLVSLITLGRAYLQNTLSIVGDSTIYKNTWYIHFDNNITPSEDSKTPLAPAIIVDDPWEQIEFGVHLEQPGDIYEFTVDIVNDSTVDASVDRIEKIELTEEQQKYLEFDVRYDTGEEIKRCDPLYKKGSTEGPDRRLIKVTVKFKDGIDLNDYPKEDVNLRLYFKIIYVHHLLECPPVVTPNLKKLTIRPNGGTYNGRRAETRVYQETGTEYTISEPTRDLYNFLGWQVLFPTEDGTYTLDEDEFTFGDEDVTIEAVWEEGDYVARIMDTYYPTIQEAFDDVDEKKWEDNTVWLLRDTTEYPVNNTSDAFTFNLDGHTVTGTITNSSRGNITLVNGRVEAEADHDEGFINNGILNLGIHDGVVEVDNSIAIVGNEIGLLNNEGGKFYFYDGYLEGYIGLVGEHTGVEEGYYVFTNHIAERDCQKVYLVKNPSRAVAKTLTKGEIYYYNLQDGINSVRKNKSVFQTLTDDDYVLYIIRDFEAAYELETRENTRTFISLEGYEIQIGKKLNNKGYLYMHNDKDMRSILKPSMTFENDGELKIENVNIIMTTDSVGIANKGKLDISNTSVHAKNNYAVTNTNQAEITFDADTSISADTQYGLYNSSPNLIINHGDITGFINEDISGNVEITGDARFNTHSYSKDGYTHNDYGVLNYGVMKQTGAIVYSGNTIAPLGNCGTYNFYSGTLDSASHTVENRAANINGTINVYGGEIKGANTTITRGTVNVRGGKVLSENGNTIYDSTLAIYEGEVYSEHNTVQNYGNIYVYGGEFKANDTAATNIGTFYIEAGKVTSENNGISTSNAVIKGGLVEIKNTAITTSSATVSGGHVKSTEMTGMVITSSGLITGGKIEGDIYGINSRGEITLGVDDEDISSESPEIIGGSFGLYIEGPITNFYDGILKGQVDGYNEEEHEGFVKGRITGTPLGGTIGEGTEEINEKVYETDFVVRYENWIRVNGEEYNSINTASQACPEDVEEECMMEVFKDPKITFVQQFIDENNNKKFVLDLAGHTIESTQTIINSVANVRIIDSSEDKTGTFYPTRVPIITNRGGLIIDNANFVTDRDIYAMRNESGSVTINNANYNAYTTAIYNAATITINDVNIEANRVGIESDGTVILNGGVIKGNDHGIDNDGRVEVHGGLIEGNAGVSGYYGSLYIDGGKIHGINSNGVYGTRGSFTMDGGEVISDHNTGVDQGEGTTVNGGHIKGTLGLTHHIVCYNVTCVCYDVNITGGLIEGTVSNGFNQTCGTSYITGGDIYGEIDGVDHNGSYMYVGVDEGAISTSVPLFQGKRYGLNTHGYIKFSDGILKGKELAHTGLISEIPDATMIKDDYEFINREEYKTQYLVEFGDWLEVRGEKFNTLTDACDYAVNGDTIKVIADAYVNFQQELVNNKNLTFDINGHTVIMTQPLVTKGTNIIKNSKTNGGIHNLRDIVINNVGTLTIENGEYISDVTYAISNNGTMTINDITLDTYGGVVNGGTLTINGGTINGKSAPGLYNNGTVYVKGGYIHSDTSISLNAYNGWTHIEGGEIENNVGNGIEVSSGYNHTGRLEVTGGEIRGKLLGVRGVTNGEILIKGGHIVGYEGTGVRAESPSARITGGVIEGSIYGLYSIGTTTIGEDDGTITIDLPVIKGDTYGLYIEQGTLNFNDGILKGITNANYGQITNIPNRAQIFIDEEDIDGKHYETKYLIMETDIAKNLNTGVIYSNLQDSLDEAGENETVQLLTNVPLYYAVTNNNQNNYTLDLNGYTISTNKPITNNGKLTITNSSNKEAFIKTSSAITLITNTNTLYLEDVTVKNTSSDRYVVYSNNTLSLNGTKIDAINGVQTTNVASFKNANIVASRTAIDNSGVANVDGGTYQGGSNSYYSNSGRESKVENATFIGNFYNNRGTLRINECTITKNSYQSFQNNSTVYMYKSEVNGDGLFNNTGTIYIDESIVNQSGSYAYDSRVSGINNTGSMTITKSEVHMDEDNNPCSESTAIHNSGTLNVSDNTTITVGLSANTNVTNTGIRVVGNGSAIIDNSTIKVNGGSTGYGIYVSDSNSHATILTGNIEVKDSKVAYGAYANYGIYTMGHYEGVEAESELVSDTNPRLYASGTTRGIGVKKVNGQFEFYDGIVWGSRYAKPETTTLVEKLYEVTTYVDQDTGFEYAVLEYMGNDYQGKPTALLNGVYYQSLQEAIDVYYKAPEGSAIKLLKPVAEDIHVDINNKAIIDLNSYSVTGKVTNNGELQVYNGSLQSFDERKIDEETGETIEPTPTVTNNGTFIMGLDDGRVSSTNTRVVAEGLAIDNHRIFKMYDGYLEGNPTINGDIQEIANFARIHTVNETQYERKYLQSLDEAAIRRKETALILTIDPLSGFYDNKKGEQHYYLFYEEEMMIKKPTKNGCTFVRWEVSDSERYELIDDPEGKIDGKITMDVRDIKMTAVWEVSERAVAKVGEEYYESLREALEAAKEGEVVELLKDVEEDITVTKEVTINLGGHTVTGVFINQGILTIYNGEINNPDPDGIGLVNLKTLTMGILTDGEVKIDDVRIIGGSLGLQQDGRFNFYDGAVEGDISINGDTNATPKGFFAYTDHNDVTNKQRTILSGNPENAVASISNGEAIQFFFKLPDAIATAKLVNREIKIERDFEAAYEIAVPEDANIVINMNSHDITTGNNISIEGELLLYDNSEDSGSITSTRTITNEGKLTIQGIKLHQTKSVDTLVNNGELIIKDNVVDDISYPAIIEATDKYAVVNNGDLKLLGNYELNGNSYALNQNGTVNDITTGKIHGITWYKDTSITGDVVITNTINGKSGILNVHDITLDMGTTTCIYTNQASNLTINVDNATLNCGEAIYTNGGSNININVSNSEINASLRGYRINTSSTKVTSTNTNVTAKSYAILNESTTNEYRLDGNYISTNDAAIYDNVSTNSHNRMYYLNGGLVQGVNHGINGRCLNLYIENTEVKTTSTNRDHYAIYIDSWDSIYLYDGAFINAPNASGIRSSSNIFMYDGSRIYSGAQNGFGIRAVYLYLEMEGGVIETPGKNAYGIYTTNDNSNLRIDDGLIESGNIGIQLSSTTTNSSYTRRLNLNGGSIQGDTYGVYVTEAYTINVGNVDDEDSQSIPLVTGGTYGIYRTTGTINFYNGRLRGYIYGYNNEMNTVKAGKDIITVLEDIPEHKSITTNTTTSLSADPISNYAKLGNGYAKITYKGDTTDTCENNQSYAFNYVGDEDEFVVPCSGKYTLEVWGAQGGGTNPNENTGSRSGAGGYSYGEIDLNKDETLYINVGGRGVYGSGQSSYGGPIGGYNGGGNGGNSGSGSGGGATHIATVSGLLSTLENDKDSIIIVAGGGGGSDNSGSSKGGSDDGTGGSGGGYKGGAAIIDGSTVNRELGSASGMGGTQVAGYAFGQGQHVSTSADTGGAGGGWYGGYVTNNNNGGGAGGSGYTGNPRLSNTIMYGYNVPYLPGYWVNNFLVEKDDFLQVGDKTFNDINDAIAELADVEEGTITVIKDAINQQLATFPSGKTITFDLNGHTLESSKKLVSKGHLIIVDNSEEKTGKIVARADNVVENDANLTITGVTLETLQAASVVYAHVGSGNLLIEDSTLTSVGNGIYSDASQKITVKNSTFDVQAEGVRVDSNSNVITITDSDFTSKGITFRIEQHHSNTLKIERTNALSTTNRVVYVYGQSNSLFFNDCNFESPEYRVFETPSYGSNNNTISIDGGTYKGAEHGFVTHSIRGTIKNATIETTSTNRDHYAIHLEYYSSLTLDNTKLIANNASGIYLNEYIEIINNSEITAGHASAYGIYNQSGSCKIVDSKITTPGSTSYGFIAQVNNGNYDITLTNAEIDSNNIGLYLSNGTRTVYINSGSIKGTNMAIYQPHSGITTTIGRLDDDLDQQNPRLESDNVVISKSAGTLRFYNGRLVTKNKIINGDFNAIRPDMEIKYDYSYDGNALTLSTTDNSDDAIEKTPKKGNGHARITYLENSNINSSGNINESIIDEINDEYKSFDDIIFDYQYTGDSEVFTTPVSGSYKIQLWGAQGGNYNSSYLGGKGGYTEGVINLEKNDKLYVYVGEFYNGYKNELSFNGGGKGNYSTQGNDKNYNGGGATDVRLLSGKWDNFESLKSRIMVAAGGGGANNYGNGTSGGYGGGLTGGAATSYAYGGAYMINPASGGTQTSGGLYAATAPYNQDIPNIGHFGIGGYSNTYTSTYIYNAGGGGGYYGGGSGGSANSHVSAAGGGSSFISGYEGCDAITSSSTPEHIVHTGQPNHYSGKVFTDAVMKAGNESMPTHDNIATVTGNTGDGYAKISYHIDENKVIAKFISGTEVEYIEYNVGDTLGSLPTPSIESGRVFNGWYLDKAYTKKVNSNTVINVNATLYAKISIDSSECNSLLGKKYEFNYIGDEDVFIPSCSGTYKLEVWGAQGGSYGSRIGGYGAYSSGLINLSQNERLFINVGGTTETITGGYNGGGNAGTNYDAKGGGGATSIATSSGLLSTLENNKDSILIVAGGGGGIDNYNGGSNGGSGGGAAGVDGSTSGSGTLTNAKGGTQEGPGASASGACIGSPASFGQGGSHCSNHGGGGGGGYYGGGGGAYNGGIVASGAGGSGYIDNPRITDGVMYGYNAEQSGISLIEAYLDANEGFLEVDGIVYNSFDNAIAAIETSGTIKLLKDIEVKQTVEFPAGKTITFDLNGHTIETTTSFINKAELIITDNSGSIGSMINNYNEIIRNQGILTVNKGKYYAANVSFYGYGGEGKITVNSGVEITGRHATYAETKHEIILNGVNIDVTNYAARTNAANSSIIVTDCNIKSGDRALQLNAANSVLEVNDSDITGSGYTIYNNGQSNQLTVNDSTVTSTTTHALCNETSYNTSYLPSFHVNNSEIVGATHAVWIYYSRLYADNTEIRTTSTNRDHYAIYSGSYGGIILENNSFANAPYASGIRSESTIELTDSRVYAGASNAYGIYSQFLNLKFNNSSIEAPGTSAYGIYGPNTYEFYMSMNSGSIKAGNIGVYLTATNNYTRTVTIKGGEIIGQSYGLYQSGTYNTVIGDGSKTVSITNPTIEGGLYGLYKTSDTVSMYSGILKGGTGAYSGYVNNIRENYELYESTGGMRNEIASLRSYSVTTSSELPITNTPKQGNGYAKVSYKSPEKTANTISYVDEISGDKYDSEAIYNYSESEQVFKAPVAGTYKIEAWGAQGGTINTSYIGGYGGYSTGYIYLEENATLYINVGGQGSATTGISQGGYNGGGIGTGGTCTEQRYGGSGGGATSIATSSGLLSTLENNKSSIIMVAGGGGGAHYLGAAHGSGAAGGGFVGNTATWVNSGHSYYVQPQGGTQTQGGLLGYSYREVTQERASFGQGGDYEGSSCAEGSGGGGGYYGGGAGYFAPGGGGSGYIGNTSLTNKYMYCYNCQTSSETDTYTKSDGTTSCHSSEPYSDCAKEGNGSVKISLVNNTEEYEFDYTNDEQTYTTPRSGYYKLEVWGAQGGSISGYNGGYGGYSTGVVYLNKGTTLYVNVGGEGQGATGQGQALTGGYNGGGNVTPTGVNHINGAGGGATHIATKSGELPSLSDSRSDVLIVAGGGGGARDQGNHVSAARWGAGGSGGGFKSSGAYSNHNGGTPIQQTSCIATQDSGPSFGQGENCSGNSAGGGGWYGGYSGGNSDSNPICQYLGSGSGGSGYIGYEGMTDRHMTCYNCEESTEDETRTFTSTETSIDPLPNTPKVGNGYAKITMIGDLGYVENGTTYDYSPSGMEETFTAPASGVYKLEVWGAQGGSNGGYGGYSTGYVSLTRNQNLYINVGGAGENQNGLNGGAGGYNGGGTGGHGNPYSGGAGGGGATHIAFTSLGELKNYDNNKDQVLIVAGGGGGSCAWSAPGAGGGISGNNSTSRDSYNGRTAGAKSIGGTQDTGYAFGLGQNGQNRNNVLCAAEGGGGGGGGWYGGTSYQGTEEYSDDSGGGGSGYIGNDKLKEKHMYCYNCQTSTDVNTYTKSNGEDSCYSSDPTADCSKADGGFARITYVANSSLLDEIDNTYKITLITDRGTLSNTSIEYTPGAKLGELPIPSSDDSNYEFDGWFLDSNLTRKVTSDTVVKGDAILYAGFNFVNNYCISLFNTTYDFDYTGGPQTFDVECPGVYTLETWGAQGGEAIYNANAYRGGFGGYSYGEITLLPGEKLYIYVGGQGQGVNYQQTAGNYIADDNFGYNGGGYANIYSNNSAHGGGGGATHIATRYGLLSEQNNNKDKVLIVGAGGGGASAHASAPSYSGNGGSGGGYIGGSGSPANNTCYNYGTGGNQGSIGSYTACATAGRTDRPDSPPNPGIFGHGSNYTKFYTNVTYAGGGAGWYGGEAGWHAPGGGGSGYTGNTRLSNQRMYGYDIPAKADGEYLHTAYLVVLTDKVINKTTNVKYTNLQTAFDEASDEDVIELLGDTSIPYNIVIPDVEVTLDLHGYELTTTKQFTNNGNLTIIDTLDSGDSKLLATISDTFITNNSSLTVKNVDIESYTAIVNKAGSTLNVEGVSFITKNISINNQGTLTGKNLIMSGGSYGIHNNSTNESTIDGLDVSASTCIYTASNGKLTVTNVGSLVGNINNSSSPFNLSMTGKTNSTMRGIIYNQGTTIMKNMSLSYGISEWNNYIYLDNYGTMTFDHMTLSFNESYNSTDRDDSIIYNRGTFTSVNSNYTFRGNGGNKHAYMLENHGIMKSTNDTIDMSGTNYLYGYWTNTSNLTEIRNTNITINSENYGYGVFQHDGSTGVSGGNITVNAPNAYGFYNRTSTSATENATYNVNGTSNAYGIYINDGTFNYLTGTVNASAPNSSGIYLNNGNLNVTGGNIIATGTTTYGIRMINGTFNLGTEGNGVDTSTPNIESKGTTTGYGTSNGEGNFNYYDGKILGSTSYKAPGDVTTNVETSYQVKELTYVDPETNIEYKYCILEIIY